MRLDVCLIDDVQPVLVTQIQERWIVRVVAGAHCIAVVLLHRNHIGTHVVPGYRFTSLRMMIVAIYSANSDALIVDPYFAVFHTNASKSRYQRRVLALWTEQLHHHAIPLRVFRRPRTSAGNRQRRRHAMACENIFLVVLMGNLAHHGFAHASTRQLLAPDL